LLNLANVLQGAGDRERRMKESWRKNNPLYNKKVLHAKTEKKTVRRGELRIDTEGRPAGTPRSK